MRVRTSLVVCLAGLGGVNGQQGSMPTVRLLPAFPQHENELLPGCFAHSTLRLFLAQPQVQVNQVSTGKAGSTTYRVAVDFDGAVARDVYGAQLVLLYFLPQVLHI